MLQLQKRGGACLRHGRALILAAFLSLCLAFIASPVQAAIRYVDLGGVNTGTCSSPGTACNTIDRAIDQATTGDDIYVRAGTYTEPPITVSKQVTITGGFNPDNGDTLWEISTYTLTPTILDGQKIQRPLYISTDGVVLQFLTVRNGNATDAVPLQDFGGGILVLNAEDVILRGLKIENNVASTEAVVSSGGGIALIGGSDLRIERTIVFSNSAPSLGGGIGVQPGAGQLAILAVYSSLLAHNSSAEGGAFSTSGTGRSAISFYHTTFGHNNLGSADEAVFMTGGDAVTGNSLDFSYSLLTGNTTAVRINTSKTPQMLSTALILDPNVTNDWEGSTVPGLSPALKRSLPFVNPTAGDYHLAAASPAIDIAGNTVKVDLEGRQRANTPNCTPFSLCPLGRSDDYGAYEYVYSAPSIRYVTPDGNQERNNCLNPDLPCGTLEDANFLSLGGDEIRVTVGVYQGGDGLCVNANTAVLCLRQGITVTGGFTTTNWNSPSTNPALTVFDGTNIRQGIQVDYNVPNASSLIRNFTVRNGYNLTNGGGIAIGTQNIGPAQNLAIRNCRVENSRGDGTGDGGGIYANAPVNLRVENCTIFGNSVPDGRGGGLAINDNIGTSTYTLTNLTVHSNVANRPDENSANGGMGGGIFLQGIGTLRQSEVYSNVAAFSGGGVTTGSNNADPTIDRVYIHDNRASLGGGFSIFLTGGATLQNSLLVRNVATSTVGLLTGQTNEPMMGGNAIHSPYLGVPDEPLNVINVTIADNDGTVDNAIKIEGLADGNSSRRNNFTNVLISGNTVGMRSDGDGFANLVKVLMTNDVITKTDNFNVARLSGSTLSGAIGFVGSDDYHLLPGSDGVDDGDNVVGVTQDLDGVSRPIGPAFDIGAYETTVNKENQTISFAPILNHALADTPVPTQPTSSSGLPVQLTSLTPAICTVSGTSINLLAIGTCSIQANQPGNPAFNAAPSVTRTFEIGIEKPPETLRLPVLERQ